MLLLLAGCTREPPPRAASPAPPVVDAGVREVLDAATEDAHAADAEADAHDAAPPPPAVFATLPEPAGTWLHPPATPTPGAPLVVFLHGMCALPEWECPVFRPAADAAWLLCPPGPTPCQGGGAMWTGSDTRIEGQIGTAIGGLPEGVDLERRALIGYSLGAPAALRMTLREPGRWQRLMIVNAPVVPSAAQLTRAGITRIALVSGGRDRTTAKLQAGARTLARQGVDARYFSMGPVGHYFDAESSERLRESIEWLLSGL